MGQVANYYGTVATSQLTPQLSQLGQAESKAAADVKRFYQTMAAGVVSNEGKTSHFKTTKVITE